MAAQRNGDTLELQVKDLAINCNLNLLAQTKYTASLNKKERKEKSNGTYLPPYPS